MRKCLVKYLYWESQERLERKSRKHLECNNCPLRHKCAKWVAKENNKIHIEEDTKV